MPNNRLQRDVFLSYRGYFQRLTALAIRCCEVIGITPGTAELVHDGGHFLLLGVCS